MNGGVFGESTTLSILAEAIGNAMFASDRWHLPLPSHIRFCQECWSLHHEGRSQKVWTALALALNPK